jgi:tRNA 2-thiouridine synthesizing protein A
MTEYDDEIDAIGLKCPMPILKCKKGLNALKINQILRIKTTDKSAKKDFEAFCKNTGHDLISYEIENEITTFYIKKN